MSLFRGPEVLRLLVCRGAVDAAGRQTPPTAKLLALPSPEVLAELPASVWDRQDSLFLSGLPVPGTPEGWALTWAKRLGYRPLSGSDWRETASGRERCLVRARARWQLVDRASPRTLGPADDTHLAAYVAACLAYPADPAIEVDEAGNLVPAGQGRRVVCVALRLAGPARPPQRVAESAPSPPPA